MNADRQRTGGECRGAPAERTGADQAARSVKGHSAGRSAVDGRREGHRAAIYRVGLQR